jgi:hypothetical protein
MGKILNLYTGESAATVLGIDYSHGIIYARCQLTGEELELRWYGRFLKNEGDFIYYNIKENTVSRKSTVNFI